MDDNSKMTFGKYAGVKMANIPPDYLLWLYENAKLYGEVKEYIEDNMDVLKVEIERKTKYRKPI
jgi:uncharacterized protein (DUF3820 family)